MRGRRARSRRKRHARRGARRLRRSRHRACAAADATGSPVSPAGAEESPGPAPTITAEMLAALNQRMRDAIPSTPPKTMKLYPTDWRNLALRPDPNRWTVANYPLPQRGLFAHAIIVASAAKQSRYARSSASATPTSASATWRKSTNTIRKQHSPARTSARAKKRGANSSAWFRTRRRRPSPTKPNRMGKKKTKGASKRYSNENADMADDLPIVLTLHTPGTNAGAVDTEVYCINVTREAVRIAVSSTGFSTIDDEGTLLHHGSPPLDLTLAPGEAARSVTWSHGNGTDTSGCSSSSPTSSPAACAVRHTISGTARPPEAAAARVRGKGGYVTPPGFVQTGEAGK